MPKLTTDRSIALAVLVALGVAAGCGELQPPAEGPVQVMLAITTVPADVACVRFTATAPGRTILREVDVMAGASLSEAFAGLPPGPVAFLAEAFTGGCSAVTKATVPSWVSEDETVNISLGRTATVNLTMNRNGRAKVTVSFPDERRPDGGAPDA